jgi:hypothetical protein
LGNLIKIRIGHDGTGFGSGWFLDKVFVFCFLFFVFCFLFFVFCLPFVKVYITNPISSQQWIFLCGRWLDKHEDDKQTIRELVTSADGVASQPSMNFLPPLHFASTSFPSSLMLTSLPSGTIQSAGEDRRH